MLGRTQAEVKGKLSVAIAESQQLDVSRSEEYTVEWLRLWFELYAKPNIWPSTAGYYRRGMEEYTIPRMGTTKLNKLTSREIQKLYKDLLENGRTRVAVWVKFFRHLKVRIFYIAKRPENDRFRGVLWS